MSGFRPYPAESISGKRVLVTGGTSGIGRATALMLAGSGAHVFVFGLHRHELDATLEEAKANGLPLDGTLADVTNKEEVLAVFRQVADKWGRLDVLVNCAAVGVWAIADTPFEEWQRALQVNIAGYLHTTQEALRLMEGGGHLVQVGSMSAEVRETGSSIYVATKAAIEGFGGALRKEASARGIRVTVIEPGATATPMQSTDTEWLKGEVDAMRMMDPGDVAASIRYALTQPRRVNVALVQLHPVNQVI